MERLIPEYLGLLNKKDKKTICYITFIYETKQSFRCFFLKPH